MDLQSRKIELIGLLLQIDNTKVLTQLKEMMITAQKSSKKFKVEDDTAYLNSTENNRKQLEKSIDQANRGEKTTIAIEDLWK
jgi:hypothetical protein